MLNRLAEVQAMDLELDGLREERGEVPQELVSAEERKVALEGSIAVKREERDLLRRRVNESELELKSMEELRRNASANALRAQTPKEASQYQNQELQFGTRVQELEEDTLPLMEKLDEVAAEVESLESDLNELLPQLEELLAAEEERVAAVDAGIERVMEQRGGVASEIDASLMRTYEQVRKARRGLGLAEVVANATCSGCNVKLPIHVVQKARKGDSVTRCPSCGRILRVVD